MIDSTINNAKGVLKPFDLDVRHRLFSIIQKRCHKDDWSLISIPKWYREVGGLVRQWNFAFESGKGLERYNELQIFLRKEYNVKIPAFRMLMEVGYE